MYLKEKIASSNKYNVGGQQGCGSSRIFSLPLPASFFKLLPLPQKFNLFQLPLMKNASASGSSKSQMV